MLELIHQSSQLGRYYLDLGLQRMPLLLEVQVVIFELLKFVWYL